MGINMNKKFANLQLHQIGLYWLGKRDKVHYSILDNGNVLLSRGQQADSDDPVLGHFLNFLSQDLAAHPERLQALDSAWINRLQSLVGNVQFDLDTPLPDDEA